MLRITLSTLALTLAATTGAGAQEQEPPTPVHVEEGKALELPGVQDEAQQEMLQLFAKVERQLRQIDVLLSDAGAGDTSALKDVGPAGIDQLLRNSVSTGRQTIEDIDRILELAAQMGGGSPSSGGGSGQPQDQASSQKSPLDRGQQSTQRENTSENPDGQQPGQEPKPGEGDPSQPEPSDGQPASPLDADDPNRENQLGDDPPGLEQAGPAGAVDDAERWGDLPVHVRDMFRYEGSDGMPPEYRDWIDAYYRKLNDSTRKR